MAGCHLAWHQQLHAGVKALRDLREGAEARVLENGDSPLGLFGGDEPASLEEQRTDIAIEAPQAGTHAGCGSGGTRPAQYLPERREVLLRSSGRRDPEVPRRRGSSRSDGVHVSSCGRAAQCLRAGAFGGPHIYLHRPDSVDGRDYPVSRRRSGSTPSGVPLNTMSPGCNV